jgi:hypothetical protein
MSSHWLHEQAGVVATIDPANHNNSTQNSDYIDMAKFHEVMAVLLLGSVDNTVDFKLREADDTGGTNEQDVSGKAITQLTGSSDNKQAVLALRADECSKRYVRARATVGNGTTNIVAAVVLGVPRFGPATDDDLADVAQVVT